MSWDGWRISLPGFAFVDLVDKILEFLFGLVYTSREKAKRQSLDGWYLDVLTYHNELKLFLGCEC